MRTAAVVLVLMSVVIAGGCGRTHVEVLGAPELPADLYGSPTPGPAVAPSRTVSPFFLREARLVRVSRLVTGTGSAAGFALRTLLAGPSAEEAAQGVGTVIPAGVNVLGVTVSGHVGTVDLSPEFEQTAEPTVLVLRVAQVVFTLTELDDIDAVRFEIDGEPIDVVGQDGNTRTGPVTRRDYASFEPV